MKEIYEKDLHTLTLDDDEQDTEEDAEEEDTKQQ